MLNKCSLSLGKIGYVVIHNFLEEILLYSHISNGKSYHEKVMRKSYHES